jgi:hypothetical protein
VDIPHNLVWGLSWEETLNLMTTQLLPINITNVQKKEDDCGL